MSIPFSIPCILSMQGQNCHGHELPAFLQLRHRHRHRLDRDADTDRDTDTDADTEQWARDQQQRQLSNSAFLRGPSPEVQFQEQAQRPLLFVHRTSGLFSRGHACDFRCFTFLDGLLELLASSFPSLLGHVAMRIGPKVGEEHPQYEMRRSSVRPLFCCSFFFKTTRLPRNGQQRIQRLAAFLRGICLVWGLGPFFEFLAMDFGLVLGSGKQNAG